MELDNRDFQILEVVRENGRLPTRKIAELTGIPPTTVMNKLKSLQDNKHILQYTARLNFEKIGWKTLAYIFISLDNEKMQELKLNHEDFAEKISIKFPYVSDVVVLSGNHDLFVRIRVKNNTELNKIANRIRALNGVAGTHISLGLHEVRKNRIRSNFTSNQ